METPQFYLNGYPLYCHSYELKDKDVYRLNAAIELVESHKTLKDIEKECGIPISTMDYWVHTKLREVSPRLYGKVCDQFRKNMNRKRLKNEQRKENSNIG